MAVKSVKVSYVSEPSYPADENHLNDSTRVSFRSSTPCGNSQAVTMHAMHQDFMREQTIVFSEMSAKVSLQSHHDA